MKYFEFQADQIYCEIDDNDLILCSFAEGKSPDPEKYLILQRIINEKDLYEFEICSNENSAEGGFDSVVVNNYLLTIDFNKDMKIKFGYKGLLIKTNNNLSHTFRCLKLLFANSDCSLIIEK